MFTAALLIIAQNWNLPRLPSTGEWLHKLWYIHTMKYYSTTKSNEQLTATTWEKDNSKWLHAIWFLLYDILKSWNFIDRGQISGTQKMETWMAGGKWHDCKRTIGGLLVVLELLSILIVVGTGTYTGGKLLWNLMQ